MRFEGTAAHPKHRKEGSRLNQRSKQEKKQRRNSNFVTTTHH